SSVALNATVAAVPTAKPAEAKPTVEAASPVTPKPADTTVAAVQKTVSSEPVRADAEKAPVRPVKIVSSTPRAEEPKPQPAEPKSETSAPTGPMDIGSLVAYAVKQQAPRYPPTAKQMRATGVVRVDIVVDEDGNVAEIQKTTGHTLLLPAAREAIEKWKFKPFTRDGQPVKATGFVNFNFSL
ncbi:MAG: TonB family protein, partial [Pyrinomonadaceae bacterium]|nr:TonB family protein [Pyrinomonadaceae bacterium]